jgi:hypothetical protein
MVAPRSAYAAAGFFINGHRRKELIATNSKILHRGFFDSLGWRVDLAETSRQPLRRWSQHRLTRHRLTNLANCPRAVRIPGV